MTTEEHDKLYYPLLPPGSAGLGDAEKEYLGGRTAVRRIIAVLHKDLNNLEERKMKVIKNLTEFNKMLLDIPGN